LCLWFVLPLNVRAQISPGTHEIYVGILEDNHDELAGWQPGPSRTRLIRPAFGKSGEGWVEISRLDHELTWTIAFDGRNLGDVRSRPDPMVQSNANGNAHSLLTTADGVPTIGKPSDEFAGLGAIGGTKVRRPLVVVSEPNYADPDEWKRKTPSKELAVLVRRAYRHDFPHVYKCDEEHFSEGDWLFPDSDLRLTSTYGSNKGSFLVEIQLWKPNCYIDKTDDPWANQWFFVGSDKSVRRIGGFLKLLDAGDYDGDGRSEFIFLLSQPEDTDGYVLYTADFEQEVTVSWTYH
jgi:hypothetical protein